MKLRNVCHAVTVIAEVHVQLSHFNICSTYVTAAGWIFGVDRKVWEHLYHCSGNKNRGDSPSPPVAPSLIHQVPVVPRGQFPAPTMCPGERDGQHGIHFIWHIPRFQNNPKLCLLSLPLILLSIRVSFVLFKSAVMPNVLEFPSVLESLNLHRLLSIFLWVIMWSTFAFDVLNALYKVCSVKLYKWIFQFGNS